MSGFKVVTHGFDQLAAAFAETDAKVDPALSRSLRLAGEPVKRAVQDLARGWGAAGPGQARTASGVRIRRNKLRIRVEQGLSKTTGQHGNYGGIQMRHFFLPSLEQHSAEIEEAITRVIDDLVSSV